MDKKNLSRREFLRLSAVTVAGMALAACAPPTPPEAVEETAEATAEATTAAPPPKEVTLDVMIPADYQSPYRQIWDVFEAQNPGIKINTFTVNEDTAPAYKAKIAGGYLPAIENLGAGVENYAGKDNYEVFLNLGEIGFPWFDRWIYDVKNAWSDLYGLPGPRTLAINQGWVFTWVYRLDLMEEAGLDPWRDVKTWDDMKEWLDEGAAWAKANPDVDYFWDQGWHNWVFGMIYQDMWPLAFPDGQRDRQVDCWLGKAKFNAEDSPYRHIYEFFKEAYDKGWMPEGFWTRQWETDMEPSYIGSKSALVCHGPWVWDKALAADPNIKQSGFPTTPPAEGQATWVQSALPPLINDGWFMRAGVDKLPEWEQIKTAFFWFFSPEAVKMEAEAEGIAVVYKLDEPLELAGPQYQGILKHIGGEGFPDVKWEQGQTGQVLADPYRKEGAKGVWDWETNGNSQLYADLLTGKITVQEALDIAQKNWEESYEGLPKE